MKRSFVAAPVCLTLASLLSAAPAAEATAAGVCTISGTINFSPSASSRGRWDISPGVIACRGFFFGWHSMLGSGSFVATGSYTSVPSGAGCVEQLGPGTVDYWIATTHQHVHLIEPHAFTLAGAGAFTTPTLRGTFQIPLYDGNCVTTPRTTTLFLAQVTLARAGPRVDQGALLQRPSWGT
jgi:hypothetical protein